jgi:uncharacterized membrane protein
MTAANSTTFPRETSQRGDQRPPQSQNGAAHERRVNVPPAERWISAMAGGGLALLGLRMRSLPGALLAIIGGEMVHRGYTGHCMAYEALGVDRAEGAGAQPEEYFNQGIHVSEAVTVQGSPEQLYKFWRDLENLPQFMSYLEDVRVIDERRSHWKAKAPAGLAVEWDAEIINDEPNQTIAWRSLYPASVDSAGSVRFTPGLEGRGTEVRVTLDYIPPAGRAGQFIARIFGRDPAAEVREDLRRFKRAIEAGEVPTTSGQPHGRRGVMGTILSGTGF